MDLYEEITEKRKQLDYCIKELRKNGSDFAAKERAYKVRMRAECLALREDGMPVTLIQQVVYGVEEVADLRYERDVAETTWRANIEAIQSLRLQLRILQQQLNQEMSAPGVGYGDF